MAKADKTGHIELRVEQQKRYRPAPLADGKESGPFFLRQAHDGLKGVLHERRPLCPRLRSGQSRVNKGKHPYPSPQYGPRTSKLRRNCSLWS